MLLYNPHSRHRLIVSADDFGISPRANRNIRHLVSLGKIDRIGIMMHGIFSAEEVSEISRSRAKLDVHLDILNEFGEDRRKRQGVLLRGFGFFYKFVTRKLSLAKVEDDWREQIEKFRETFGRNPDGISSHEHVHLFPPFLKIALKLAKEYTIPYIRFGSSSFILRKNPYSHILHCLKFINHKKFRKSQAVSSESLISLDWIKDMDNFLENLPEGQTEIVCHPEIAEDFVKVKKYF